MLWPPVGDRASGPGRRPQFSYSRLPPLPGQVQPQVQAISSSVAAPIRGKAISTLGYVGAHMLVHLIQPGWGRKLVVGMKARDHEIEGGCSHPCVLNDFQISVWIQAGLVGSWSLVCSLH